MRERYRKEKTQTDSAVSVQISRAEQEVEERWQSKADRMVSQTEERWKSKYNELKEELREAQSQHSQALAKVNIDLVKNSLGSEFAYSSIYFQQPSDSCSF